MFQRLEIFVVVVETNLKTRMVALEKKTFFGSILTKVKSY